MSFKYEQLPNICYWCGCLTHDDRDCEQWIESEESLSIESQQFGPWIHGPPFIPSRKNIIKVPGFYTRRGKETSATPPSAAEKPPVVVVRTGKPLPEILRPEKESTSNVQQRNNDADFQENTSQNSCPISTNLGIPRNLNLKSANLGERRSADEIFKERIEEIDYELNRFDPRINTVAKNIVGTGKENLLASLSLTNVQAHCGHSNLMCTAASIFNVTTMCTAVSY